MILPDTSEFGGVSLAANTYLTTRSEAIFHPDMPREEYVAFRDELTLKKIRTNPAAQPIRPGFVSRIWRW